MGDKVHVLSKNGLFIFRFNDSEFGSKWCGIWKKNRKYFDYFAFKFDGEALSASNVKKFEYYNSQSAYFEFQLKSGLVREKVTCFDNRVLVSISADFKSNIEMEAGINIRDRTEDYSSGKRYSLENNRNKVEASFGQHSAYIIFDKGEFIKQEYYGIHAPGKYAIEKGFTKYLDDGAVQNKYVPGFVKAELNPDEEINFIFSTEDIDQEVVYKTIKNRDAYTKEYSELLELMSASFGSIPGVPTALLKASVDALYSYSNFLESEIYAGFPFFNEFWIRDALLILPSFLSLNSTQFVRNVLLNISKIISPSGIPSIYGGSDYPLDTPALFINDLYEYVVNTGDIGILTQAGDKLDTIINLGKDRLLEGLERDVGKATWMDTLDREFSIEIQALWAKALSRSAGLMKILGKESDSLIQAGLSIKENISRFKRDGYYSDQLKKDINSANQVFLPFFDVIEPEEDILVVTNLETHLLNEYGMLSVSSQDPTFNPKGYHNGAIWPFLTAMLAGSAYKIGDSRLGNKCMEILWKNNFDVQCSQRINEIFQPDGKPKGCPSQAWSIGLLPFIIDRYILGIRVNSLKGEIEIRKPDDSLNATRKLLLLGRQVKIEISNGKVVSNQKIEEKTDSYIIKLN